jgi:hypothetical protein
MQSVNMLAVMFGLCCGAMGWSIHVLGSGMVLKLHLQVAVLVLGILSIIGAGWSGFQLE